MLQGNENNSIDKRTFPEIWSNCNNAERDGLKKSLLKKFKCTTVTIWNWTKGNTVPPSRNDRESIARILNSKLNINVTAESLFPGR